MKKNFSIIKLEKNQEAEIISIAGGQMAVKRLADLELIPGTKIKLLAKAFFGPIIIEVRGSRLILGRGLAAKILVKSM